VQKCGKALCSRGGEAAIASRLAVPLDLRIVAARLEHGARFADRTALWYAKWPRPHSSLTPHRPALRITTWCCSWLDAAVNGHFNVQDNSTGPGFTYCLKDVYQIHATETAGVYGAGEEGLAALASDVTYVCTLWRVGCTKGKGSAFARKQHDRRGAEGAANVSAALDAAVEVARKALRAAEAGGDGDGGGNEEGEEGAEQRKDAVVDDLSR